jgi:hypothetical protein
VLASFLTGVHDVRMISPLKSIEEECLACEAAFAAEPDAACAWCCHHDQHLEPLIEPVMMRIAYILSDKPESEEAVRFRNFRPARNLPPELAVLAVVYRKAWAACYKAWAACDKAEAAYDKAWAACYKAWAACDKAEAAYDKAGAACREAMAAIPEAELKRLHDEDWPDNTWNGTNVFTTTTTL